MIEVIKLIERKNSIWIRPFKLSRWNKTDGLLEGTCPQLEKEFQEFNYFNKRFVSKLDMYDKTTKTFKIPIGYGIDKVKKFLQSNYIAYDHKVEYANNYDSKDVQIKLKNDIAYRDDFQKEAVNFLLDDRDYLKFLTLDTGFGKTFVTINVLSKLLKTSIIISANMSDQWLDKILEYTYLDKKDIFFIQGTPSILKLLKEDRPQYKIYLASTRSLISYYQNNKSKNNNPLDELFEHLGIGIKVYDEAHINFKANVSIEINSDCEKTFFLSATPERSKGSENRIYKKIFNDVPSYGNKTHFLRSHYHVRLITFYSNPSYFVEQSCMTKEGFSAIKYFNYLFNDYENIRYIYGIVKKCIEPIITHDINAKILVLLPTLENIKMLKNEFEMDKNRKYTIGEFTSNAKDTKQEELYHNLIFSTLISASTGLDLHNLRAIVCLTPYSSAIIARQTLGRLRPIKDKRVYYFDFADYSLEHMKFQRNKRLTILNKSNESIREIVYKKQDIKDYLDNNI